jgi:hypothetical protein
MVLSIFVWPEQELDGPKIASAPIDQRRLRSSEGEGAESLGSGPAPAIHSETSPAYWRVVSSSAAFIAAAREQKLVGLFTQRSEVAGEDLTGFLPKLKF